MLHSSEICVASGKYSLLFIFSLLKGNEKIHDCDCQKWQKQEEIGHKLNKYTIWLKVEKDVTIPVHYEMKGFNTLLGSHYDHYFLKYMVSSLKTTLQK